DETLEQAGKDGAIRAMNLISSLPRELQGRVVDRMDPAAFDCMLEELPKERCEELEPLVASTTDPDRLLRLWHEYHRAKVLGTAVRSEDLERIAIAIGTDKEIEEEVRAL